MPATCWKSTVPALDNLYRADPAVVAAQRRSAAMDFVEGDVRYRGTVDAAVDGVEGVIHLAALCINKSIDDPAESLDVNLVGAQHVFAAAARRAVRRVVFASSASVYGEPEKLPMHEDDPLRPQTPYCIAKRAAEHLLGFYAARHGLASNVLRYFNVYGPGQKTDAYYTSVIQVFLRRVARGEPPIIDGDGAQSMDFVHVDDVARATVMAYTTQKSGLVLNVGTGIDASVAKLAKLLVAATGRALEPQFRPRPTLVTKRAADISRIRAELAWEPRIPVEAGIVELGRNMLAELGG
ncbi:MAG: NAD-dependent epimerase/dehydratase family protein [Deltaproteobacteria bacterium]|nr:NAD-dependent epimerase/dehydratase family protein [Deltaproteobacteria bacterium]